MDSLMTIENKISNALIDSSIDKISIDEIMTLIEYGYLRENDYRSVFKIYENLYKLFSYTINIRERMLTRIWKCQNAINKITTSRIVFYDSIWIGYINYENFASFFNNFDINENLLLHIILCKLPEITKQYEKNYYYCHIPDIILRYIQINNIDPKDFILFEHITPYVYNKLSIPIPKYMIDNMLSKCGGFATEIFEANTSQLDDETLKICIKNEFRESEHRMLYDNTTHAYQYFPEIINNLILPKKHISDNMSHIDIIKKILEYKINISDSTFYETFNKYTSESILLLYIENGFMMQKHHVIYLLKRNMNLSNFIINIELNESDYFSLYIQRVSINNNYLIFEKNIQKQIQLREMFRNKKLANAEKFMKNNNLQPDRYCMDAVFGADSFSSNKAILFRIIDKYQCIPMSLITRLINIYDVSNKKLLEILAKNNINAEYMAQKY